MKAIICGGRNYKLTKTDLAGLDMLKTKHDITEVVSGGAHGADKCGEQWAFRSHVKVKHFYADWKTHGKSAGPIRNQQMADYADMCIAFPGGRGTNDMIMRAKENNLLVIEVKRNQHQSERK